VTWRMSRHRDELTSHEVFTLDITVQVSRTDQELGTANGVELQRLAKSILDSLVAEAAQAAVQFRQDSLAQHFAPRPLAALPKSTQCGGTTHGEHQWSYDREEYGGRTCQACGVYEDSGGRR
jgi:hypothetical protein